MLAAPAQAETWSCAWNDVVFKSAFTFVLTRKGKTFEHVDSEQTFTIVHESAEQIHAHSFYLDGKSMSALVLFKRVENRAPHFFNARIINGNANTSGEKPYVDTLSGYCTVH